ncbi:MAG: putative cross-wall-targeting lipoprotein signal domain-containing protein, partial [Streptococcus salivarius]
MQLGFHFGFKKSKAYGLCGVMLTILFLGMSGHSAKADEMLSPTDTSQSLKESTDNHAASYSEVGVHDDSMSQMNLQSEEVLEEKQTSLEDYSKIAVLTNSSVTTSSYQE